MQHQQFSSVSCSIQKELLDEYAYDSIPEGEAHIEDVSVTLYAVTEACEKKIDRSEELIKWFVKAADLVINKYEKSYLGSRDGVIVYAILTFSILIFLTVFH